MSLPSPSEDSITTNGRVVYIALGTKLIDYIADDSLPAFFNTDIITCTNEDHLNSILLQKFNECLGPSNFAFFNSKHVKWLYHNKKFETKSSPDFYYCHKAFNYKNTNNRDAGVSSPLLYGNVIIGEGKVDKEYLGFGELIQYVKHQFTFVQVEYRAFLTLKNCFYLLKFDSDNNIESVIKYRWNAGGNIKSFLNFFAPTQLLSMCFDKCMSYFYAAYDETDCFLGAGRDSFVFRVIHDGSIYALKISRSHLVNLKIYKKYLKSLPPCDCIVNVIPYATYKYKDEFGFTIATACLLTLGIPINLKSAVLHIRLLLNALNNLHKCNIVHGDARYPNFVLSNGSALLIDLTCNLLYSKEDARFDMKTLIASILGETYIANSEEISDFISNYDPFSSQNNVFYSSLARALLH